MECLLKTYDFLMEIGVEEIPADHIQPAISFIESSFCTYILKHRLTFRSLRCGSTPRRFALLATGMPERQDDFEIIRTGPAMRIAYQDSVLTGAGQGFLKKNGAEEKDVLIQTTDRGEFIAVRINQPGQATPDLLREWIIDLPASIPFPKRMIWKEPDLAFSRPIRWWLLLWGDQVLPLTAGGISSGDITYGNRYKGLSNPIHITAPSKYFDILKEHGILADRSERKQEIRAQLESLSFPEGGRVIIDDNLLATVTDLVESPNACTASFDEFYLRLPQKIITCTINQNQKCFGVMQEAEATANGDTDVRLSNHFVFISNGDPQHQGTIRIGNEKVVGARLADAMWYYNEDTRHPLEYYSDKLEQVVFQSELGTMAEKTRRISALADIISTQLRLPQEERDLARRSASLAKADLATLMLGEKEFTKLQGYIGMQYARATELDEVARGIYEHYMPRGQNDRLPSTLTGSIVAVADKVDTVCGIIGIGMLPTGSADPFALRRAANGVVQIIAERNWDFDLVALIDAALISIGQKNAAVREQREPIIGFFRQRINWLLQQMGLDHDVIDSVMHIDTAHLNDLIKRARAVQTHKGGDDFFKLVIGFKRVSNIIKDCTHISEFSETLLQDDFEKEFYLATEELVRNLKLPLETKDYMTVLDKLVAFGSEIDRFFEKVLVNCENIPLRLNRYALLARLRALFLRVADLALIVVDDNEK